MKFYGGHKIAQTERIVLTESSPRNAINDYYCVSNPDLPPVIVARGSCPGSVEDFSGFIVPNFYRLVSDGWIIQNPMSKTSSIHTANSGADATWAWWDGTSPQTHDYHSTVGLFPVLQGSFLPFYNNPTLTGSISRARDEAVTRVFAKAQTGNADLLIDISQISDLIHMLRKAGLLLIALAKRPETFLDLVRASREGRRFVRVPPDGKKIPVDSLSGLWCEIRFGWGPFLGTLNGIYEAVQRLDLDEIKRFTYRAQEEISFNEDKSTTWTESYSSGGLVYTNQPWFVHDESLQWRSTFRAGILLEHSISLGDALGLRLSAIPIAAWDLVPYSFIVDRFFNIGNWIRSLNPIPASSFGGAWVTEKYESLYQYRGAGLAYSKSGGTGSSYRRVEYTPLAEARYSLQRSGYIRTLRTRPPSLPVLRHDWSQLTSLFNLLDVVFLAIQRLKPPLGRRN